MLVVVVVGGGGGGGGGADIIGGVGMGLVAVMVW